LCESFPLNQCAVQILNHLLKLLLIAFVPQAAIIEHSDLFVIPALSLFKYLVELWSFVLFAKVYFLLIVILLIQKTLQPQIYFVGRPTLLVGFFFAVDNHLGDFTVSRLDLSHFFKAIFYYKRTRLF